MARTISIFIILAVFASVENEVNGILNGTRAEDGEFPFMVQLLLEVDEASYSLACGGTIISPQWILTTGICTDEDTSIVALGSNKFYHWNASDIQVHNIKTRLRHPKWEYDRHDPNYTIIYDVGLLQLEKPLVFTDKIQPIKLPDSEDVPFHVSGTISGWGPQVQSVLQDATYLRKQSVELSTDQECQKILDVLTPQSFVPAHHLCNIADVAGKCYSDAGGPLVINGIQYGIMSWGDHSCGGVAGAYSRLTNPEYRDWIRSVTGI